jgi:hypothetical protein
LERGADARVRVPARELRVHEAAGAHGIGHLLGGRELQRREPDAGLRDPDRRQVRASDRRNGFPKGVHRIDAADVGVLAPDLDVADQVVGQGTDELPDAGGSPPAADVAGELGEHETLIARRLLESAGEGAGERDVGGSRHGLRRALADRALG